MALRPVGLRSPCQRPGRFNPRRSLPMPALGADSKKGEWDAWGILGWSAWSFQCLGSAPTVRFLDWETVRFPRAPTGPVGLGPSWRWDLPGALTSGDVLEGLLHPVHSQFQDLL